MYFTAVILPKGGFWGVLKYERTYNYNVVK